jgi:fibronectin-binding autotransporter adhesin
MPHAPSLPLHKATLLAALLAPVSAFAGQFEFTDAGPYEYTDAGNWVGDVIGNNWTSSLTADQVITFDEDYLTVDPDGGGSATATISINNTSLFNHTFIGGGANRTLTLGGSISLASNSTNSNTNKVTFGSATDGQRLNIDLGSATRSISVGTNRTLEIVNVISSNSGSYGMTKIGAGTLKLTNTANTFTGNVSIGGGSPSQFGGVLEITQVADSGTASSIGQGNRITFGGATAASTLRYVGTGDSTNRAVTVGGIGATIESSGTGALKFTSTGNVDTSPSTGSRAITLGGTNTDDNTFSLNLNDQGSGKLSIVKQDSGRWILAGANTYTGDTIIDSGTLELGAADRIGDSSNLVLNGGTFATGGFSETFATLDVNANATIDFGSGDSDLVFADSSAVAWGASISLSIVNFTEGVDSIRFGTDEDGLNVLTQLAKITINGSAASIDELGYLSTVPEPSAYAAVAGVAALFFTLRRRSRDS